jgi:Zn-dependent protease
MNEKFLVGMLLMTILSRGEKYIKTPSIQIKYLKFFGAAVFIHWTFLPVSIFIAASYSNNIYIAAAYFFLAFFLVLLHELGHAFFVKKQGYSVNYIELKGTHGLCSWSYLENDRLEFDRIVISWGGVLFQLAIALPLVICDQIGLFPAQAPYFILVNIFGYCSLILVGINLIPIAPLDGATAWKIFRYIPLRRNVSLKDVQSRPKKPFIRRIK